MLSVCEKRVGFPATGHKLSSTIIVMSNFLTSNYERLLAIRWRIGCNLELGRTVKAIKAKSDGVGILTSHQIHFRSFR